VSADFPALWEKMCRYSFHSYENYLGLAGDPVEWTDRYSLWDDEPQTAAKPEALEFARYQNRVRDLTPRSKELPPGTHPFPTRYARQNSSLTFNIAAYSKQLLNEFFTEGGRIQMTEFHSPSELAALPQKVIVNSTGYGARALWKDESIVPVRGQIAWLIPQPDVHYGVQYKNVNILGRRDGIVVQDGGIGDMEGYNDASEQPDRKQAEAAVAIAAELFERMAAKRA
jgi:hypothetical protein